MDKTLQEAQQRGSAKSGLGITSNSDLNASPGHNTMGGRGESGDQKNRTERKKLGNMLDQDMLSVPGVTVVKEEDREAANESKITNNSAKQRNSIMSMDSRSESGKNEFATTLTKYIEDLHALIQIDDWHNIPGPVRSTCEGIIHMQEKFMVSVLTNADQNFKTQEKLARTIRQDEHASKTSFATANASNDSQFLKMNNALKQAKAESKRDLTHVQDNCSKLGDQVMRMNATLEVWDGKIRRLDQKMTNVSEVAQMLEDNGISQKKEFDAVTYKMGQIFLVPGIIGPAEKNNAYTSMHEFATSVHNFKSEAVQRIDDKVKTAEKKADKLVSKLREQFADITKGHEKEFTNLRTKIKQLDQEIEDLMREKSQLSDEEEAEEEADAQEEYDSVSKSVSQDSYKKSRSASEKKSRKASGQQSNADEDLSRDENVQIKPNVGNDIDTPTPKTLRESKQPHNKSEHELNQVASRKSFVIDEKSQSAKGSVKEKSQSDKGSAKEPKPPVQKQSMTNVNLPVAAMIASAATSNSFVQDTSRPPSIVKQASSPSKRSSSKKVSSKNLSRAMTVRNRTSSKSNVIPGLLLNVEEEKPTQIPKTTTHSLSSQRVQEEDHNFSQLKSLVGQPVQEEDHSQLKSSEKQRDGSDSPSKPESKFVSKPESKFESQPESKLETTEKNVAESEIDKKDSMKINFDKNFSRTQGAAGKKPSKMRVTQKRRRDSPESSVSKTSKQSSTKRKTRKSAMKDEKDGTTVSRRTTRLRVTKKESTKINNNKQNFDAEQIQRIDDLLEHQIRFEKSTQYQIEALKTMFTAYSRAMWIQSNQSDSSPKEKKAVSGGIKVTNIDTLNRKSSKSVKDPTKVNKQAAQIGVRRLKTETDDGSEFPSQTPQKVDVIDTLKIDEESSSSSASQSGEDSSQTPASSKEPKKVSSKQLASSPKTSKKKEKDTGNSSSRLKVVNQWNSQHSVISGKHLSDPLVENVDQMYTEKVARKYHFVEAYMKQNMDDEKMSDLFSGKDVTRRNSLTKLISSNMVSAGQASSKKSRSIKNAGQIVHKTNMLLVSDDQNRDASMDQTNHQYLNMTSEDGNTIGDDTTSNNQVKAGTQHTQRNNSLEANPKQQLIDSAGGRTEHLRLDIGSKSSQQRQQSRQSRQHSAASSRQTVRKIINECPRCKGQSDDRPCVEWVDILRNEFTIYIDSLFHQKMKDFIEFIEESVNVDDQIDPDNDNVIHAFYREHNTLHKMNENFRLLEYKRKKFIEKQKQDGHSPPRNQRKKISPPRTTQTLNINNSADPNVVVTDNNSPSQNKNFLTNLYHSTDFNKQHIHQQRRAPSNLLNHQTNYQQKLGLENPTQSQMTRNQNQMYRSIQVDTHNSPPKATQMRRSSARQTSQPTMYQNKTRKQNNLMQAMDLQAAIEITSSGTTQKRALNNSNTRYDATTRVLLDKIKNNKLPIISTRKAHLTIDQRVWDANPQLQNSSRITFPEGLQNVPTLKQALAQNDSDLLFIQPQFSNGARSPYDCKFATFEHSPLGVHLPAGTSRTIINQDSSYNMSPNLTAVMNLQNANLTSKVTKVQSSVQPLAVQFQELRPNKNH